MDLRRYLDERRRGDDISDERSRRSPGYEMENRRQIGYGSDFPEYNEYRTNNYEMTMHHEYDFTDDDFAEAKETTRYTPTGSNSSKRMSIDELLDKMSKSFKKELCDVMRYCKMAEAAEAEGLNKFAEGLREMCHEEFTHASFLRANLKHLGKDPEKSDPEVAKLWHKVSQKYQAS